MGTIHFGALTCVNGGVSRNQTCDAENRRASITDSERS